MPPPAPLEPTFLPQSKEQAIGDGHGRLFPSIRNPNWLVLRRRREIFAAGLSRLPHQELCVLDVGGRLQPYRPLLDERARRYVAVDPCVTPLVDVAAQGEALPFRDNEFDLAICTQVLEYFPDPQQAVAEIRRVLRPGGSLFLSVPAVFIQDNDREYWRFLPEGLRYILRKFTTVEVFAEGNSLTGIFRTINVFAVSFMRPRFLVPVLCSTVVPLLNLAAAVVERLGGSNDLFAANFSVWARK